MSMFLQVLIEGIFSGMTIAMIAMSVSLTWGVMYIVNFAQGELMMLGMFFAYYFTKITGLDPLICIPMCAAVMYFVGVTIYYTLIKRARQAQILSQLLVTYALSLILINVSQSVFGASYKTITTQAITGSIQLGGVTIAKAKLITFVVSLIVALVLDYIINRTKLGRSIKATALSPDAASLVGINAEKAFRSCMGIASAVSAVGGVALSYYFYVAPTVGSVFINYGFVACCIGGMGSIPGAVLGAVFMGLVDSFVGTYLSVSFKYLAMFAIFLLVVYKKPKGLFGW
jgi:branched-chain amino acid transport system permease protein